MYITSYVFYIYIMSNISNISNILLYPGTKVDPSEASTLSNLIPISLITLPCPGDHH